jgi:uncharacterized protein YndB with AHSA1/START domain
VKTSRLAVKIEAPAKTVWNHLIDENLLSQWLAEKARVAPEPDGAYNIESGTPLVSGNHKIIELVPQRKLTLRWSFRDFPSLVRFELSEDRSQTTVVITHTFETNPPYEIDDSLGGEAGQLKEMWAYNLGLLKTLIELGEAQTRLRIGRKPSKAVTHTLRLTAAPEEVFDTIVNPEKIKAWNPYANEIKVEKKVGGTYSFGWESEKSKTDGPGEIVEYREGRKITYTWYGNPQTLVSWEVTPIGDDSKINTQLKIVHSGFINDQNMLVDYNLGWAAFLNGLRLYIEKGQVADWLDVNFES